jgi:hypothetical protein
MVRRASVLARGSALPLWFALVPRRFWREALLSALLAAVQCVPALGAEEPRLLDARFSDVRLVTDVEQRRERITVRDQPDGYSEDRLDIVPTLGFSLHGSVYHPNLLDFALNAQVGVSREGETLRGGAGSAPRHRSDTNPQELYDLRVRLLREKPYAVTLFANRSETRRDNDFFARYTLERQSYGVQGGYTAGPWPCTVSLAHLDESETDTDRPRELTEDDARISLRNDRGSRGRTSITGTFEDFTRTDVGAPELTGTSRLATVMDWQSFAQDSLKLFSDWRYSDVDSTAVPWSTLTARERLVARHTDRLKSTYEYTLTSRETGGENGTGHEASAGLHHRLYESLDSDIKAEYRHTDEFGLRAERYGGGFDESYSKRLGAEGRLNLGAGIRLLSERRTTDGAATPVFNESQTLSDRQPTLLNNAGAAPGTIVVTDASGRIRYREGLDYRVVQQGRGVGLQREFGGAIPENGIVLVSYTAPAQDSTGFLTREDHYRWRLGLRDDLLGVYGRLNALRHYGGESLALQEIDDRVAGVDSTWRWFKAGIEEQDYASNLLPYRALRTFQRLTFGTASATVLQLMCDQSWVDYRNTDERLRTLSWIGRLQSRVARALAVGVEGGKRTERGRADATLDRDMVTAQADANYWIGQLTAKLLYQYRTEDYLAETRTRHLIALRLERRF